MSKIHNQTLLDDMVSHQSLPMPQVKKAASEILAIIREGLIRDGVVNVSNFGTFRLKQVAERQGINPRTREALIIPAHQRVIFSPCKALRELIQPIHQPPVPLKADETSTPEKLEVTASAENQQAKDTPSQETINLLPVAKIEETQTTTTVEQTVTPTSRQELSDNDETSFLAHQVTEHKTVESSDNIQLPQTPQIAAAQEAPVTDNQSHDAIILCTVEGNRVSETESVTGSKYKKATALLLIALVCTGLFFEFGNHHEAETESIAKSTPTATRQTEEVITSISAEDSPEADSSNTVTPVTKSSDTITTEGETSEPENTVSAVVTSEESAKKTHDNDSVAVSDDNKIAPVSTASTTAAPVDDNVASNSTTSATAVPASAASQPAELFFQKRQHQVTHGESLWRLSRKYYQDPLLWPHIFQANASTVDDPDHLDESSNIIIPTLEGSPGKLSKKDRHNIAQGYYLTYMHYKKIGRNEAFFALLEAKRYDSNVVEEHRRLLHLSQVEEIILAQQLTMPF